MPNMMPSSNSVLNSLEQSQRTMGRKSERVCKLKKKKQTPTIVDDSDNKPVNVGAHR